MSSIVERANAEADAAELENPDSEEAAEAAEDEAAAAPEPEPAPEPSSQKQIEEYERKVKGEATRHENALAKLHPDDWESYAMCPLCVGDGFLTPIPPGELPDVLWEAITVMAGRWNTGGLKKAPFAERCEICDGRGMLDPDANNDANREIVCPTCAGYGWLDTRPPGIGHPVSPNAKKLPPAAPQLVGVPSGLAPAAEPFPDSGMEFVPFPGGVQDEYGRPAGHPRWGLPTTADGRRLN